MPGSLRDAADQLGVAKMAVRSDLSALPSVTWLHQDSVLPAIDGILTTWPLHWPDHVAPLTALFSLAAIVASDRSPGKQTPSSGQADI
jgi:hypothetical protein